jgi:hypothetical protein
MLMSSPARRHNLAGDRLAGEADHVVPHLPGPETAVFGW